jgi:hypothetical protein
MSFKVDRAAIDREHVVGVLSGGHREAATGSMALYTSSCLYRPQERCVGRIPRLNFAEQSLRFVSREGATLGALAPEISLLLSRSLQPVVSNELFRGNQRRHCQPIEIPEVISNSKFKFHGTRVSVVPATGSSGWLPRPLLLFWLATWR